MPAILQRLLLAIVLITLTACGGGGGGGGSVDPTPQSENGGGNGGGNGGDNGGGNGGSSTLGKWMRCAETSRWTRRPRP